MPLHPCLAHMTGAWKKRLEKMSLTEQRQFVLDNIDTTDAALRQNIMGAKVKGNLYRYLDDIPNEDIDEAVMAMTAQRGVMQERGYGSLYGRVMTIRNQVHNMLADLMEHHRPSWFGRPRDMKGQRNIISELMGRNTGDDVARGFAQQWQKVTKYLFDRFNAAGGNAKELADFGLPMFHDAVAIKNAGFDHWFAITRDLINKDRLAKVVVGGRAMTDDEFALTMRKIYNKLSTDGYLTISDVGLTSNVKKQIGSFHQEHRVLHFTDDTAWLKYFDEFGSGEPYGAMTAYTDMMSRQIGAMEMFGPKPDETIADLMKYFTERVGDNGNRARAFMAAYDDIMGRTHGPRTTFGDTMQSLRSLSVISHIGMATVASFGDMAFSGVTARLRGLPMMKMYGRFFSSIASGGSELRTLANKMMFGAEYALMASRAAARVSEVYGHRGLARGADASIRASGLHFWTETLKQTFRVEYGTYVAEHAGKMFNDLPKPLKTLFKNYGIEEIHWDRLRTAPMAELHGVKFLDWSGFRDSDSQEALAKMVGAIVEETHMAVPEPNPRINAIMHQGLRTGTPAGELIRTGGLFKSFAVSSTVGTISRATSLGPKDRLTYLASLITGATILGTISVQTREMLKGNDPFNWEDPELYGKGFLQGGVGGILFDFLFSDPNQYGAWASLIGGPVIGDAERVMLRFVGGTMQDVLAMEQDFAAAAADRGINTLKGMMPGRMWYSRLAIERAIELFQQRLADPVFDQKQQALRRKMQSEEGRGRWFEPGDVAPSRLPDIGME